MPALPPGPEIYTRVEVKTDFAIRKESEGDFIRNPNFSNSRISSVIQTVSLF